MHPDATPFPPNDQPIARALQFGERVLGQNLIVRDENGKKHRLLGYEAPVYSSSGERIAAVVSFADITEQKRTERELDRFRSLAEASPDLVAMVDAEGKLLYLNPAGRRLLGVVDAVGTPLSQYHTPQGLEIVLKQGLSAAKKNGSWRGESAVIGPKGQVIPVSQVLTSHRDSIGNLQYYATVMQDLRPVQDLQAQISSGQRLESVGRLAGGVAHDFNNLLTVILNYTYLVQSQLDPGSSIQEDLGQIALASKRAADLCQQLLAVARKQTIRPKEVDLGQVIVELSKLFGRTLGGHISVKTQVEEDLWTVFVDRSQVGQVLMNLVVNARDAMTQGGDLLVEGKNCVLTEQQAALRPSVEAGDYVMLAVTDTGIGMSAEVRDRAFEPFFTTRRDEKGTGLGLATVHGAVVQNGGHIRLESVLGEGTRVEIYIPRQRKDGADDQRSPGPRTPPGF
ncbi:MAG: two-component system cell cycle sensor histidine kinase/response regulator CckA [Cognaticolwellia sp.]